MTNIEALSCFHGASENDLGANLKRNRSKQLQIPDAAVFRPSGQPTRASRTVSFRGMK